MYTVYVHTHMSEGFSIKIFFFLTSIQTPCGVGGRAFGGLSNSKLAGSRLEFSKVAMTTCNHVQGYPACSWVGGGGGRGEKARKCVAEQVLGSQLLPSTQQSRRIVISLSFGFVSLG